MKVRFVRDYDYTPSLKPQVLFAYKAGWQGLVKRECGEAAIGAGAAVEVKSDEIAPAADAERPNPGSTPL